MDLFEEAGNCPSRCAIDNPLPRPPARDREHPPTLTNPQSLNLYAYVGNDPNDGQDPNGHALYDGRLRSVVGDYNNYDESEMEQQADFLEYLEEQGETNSSPPTTDTSSAPASSNSQNRGTAATTAGSAQQQNYLNKLASGLRLVPVEDYSPGEGVADRSVKYVIQNADGTPYASGGKTGNPDLYVNEIMSGGKPGGTVPVGNGQYTSASPSGEKNQWNDSLGNKFSTATADYKQSFIISGASGPHPAISAPLMVRYGGKDYGTIGVHIENGVAWTNGLTKFPGTGP